jgi:hypothetical protein
MADKRATPLGAGGVVADIDGAAVMGLSQAEILSSNLK